MPGQRVSISEERKLQKMTYRLLSLDIIRNLPMAESIYQNLQGYLVLVGIQYISI